MNAWHRLFRVLSNPFDAVVDVLQRPLRFLPVGLLMATTGFLNLTLALKTDLSASALNKMRMSGDLANATEFDIAEKMEQAQRIALVGGLASAIFLVPLMVLVFSIAIKALGWLMARKIKFFQAWTLAGLVFIPMAIKNLLAGAVLLSHGVVSSRFAADVLPSSLAIFAPIATPAGSLFQLVNLFALWSLLIFVIGFSHLAQWPRWKALVTGTAIYLLVGGAALVSVAQKGTGS